MSEWREWGTGDIGGWTRGDGRNAAVLLHGGPDMSDYLEELGDLLAEELGDDWTIVRYQQRGLAPSTLQGPFTIEQELQDLTTICDGLHTDSIWILGHSWGGHLAMHAIAAAPDRYRGAVIVDPLGAVGDGGRPGMFNFFASRLSHEEATEWLRLEELSNTEGLNPERRVAQFAILWPYYFSDPATAPPMPPIRMGLGDHDASIAEHFEKGTLAHRLPLASTPAIFVAGTKSPIAYEESVRSAALMSKAEVVLLPTGHFPWVEDQSSTLAAAVSFLRNT